MTEAFNVDETNEARADAAAVLDAAFRAYAPNHAAELRKAEGPTMCSMIEEAIADALLSARAGIGQAAPQIRSRDLADFTYGAAAIVSEVAAGHMAANEPWMTWDDLNETGRAWATALVRETVASCFAARTRAHDEVQFWRRHIGQMVWFDCNRFQAAFEGRDENTREYSSARLLAAVAAYDAVLRGEWHERCEACNEFILPGEPDRTDETSGGTFHVRCCTGKDEPRGPDQTDEELMKHVEQARALIGLPDPAAPKFELRLPCPTCHGDTFVTTGDRHAETAKDVCPMCRGEKTIPAGTGESVGTAFKPAEAF